MRDEKEEIKKQARSNKQTRQSNTAHPRQSEKNEHVHVYMYMNAKVNICICTLYMFSRLGMQLSLAIYMYMYVCLSGLWLGGLRTLPFFSFCCLKASVLYARTCNSMYMYMPG